MFADPKHLAPEPPVGRFFVPQGVVLPAQSRALHQRVKPITFTGAPHALSHQGWDVFSDGSVVVVPTFGHPPGSA